MEMDDLIGLETQSPHAEHTVYELFKWSLILKGVISVGEVLAGTALLLVPSDVVIGLVQDAGIWLAQHFDSALALTVTNELASFGHSAALFVAFYLLTRGLVKTGLIWALLRNALWAYPASLLVLGLLLTYQLYEIFHAGSVFIIGISLFDIIVMYLIWREWRIVKQHHGLRPE